MLQTQNGYILYVIIMHTETVATNNAILSSDFFDPQSSAWSCCKATLAHTKQEIVLSIETIMYVTFDPVTCVCV